MLRKLIADSEYKVMQVISEKAAAYLMRRMVEAV